ncbi:hypothetical protein [Bradyrhizobium sp. LHD-71]|uniref:hypothetical protein n=1 Tax=Bradyrhizobium sp. LHD-71 TaxID=3072141 RepID=UPI00280FE56A|nr:hypothetical protein [Bradyrhizobium sp. LHD-71]MDQ8730665.1 hypothetical protein [Bradyrhizobium sp. LHD-71]
MLLASIAALVVTSFDAQALPALRASSGQQVTPADAVEFGARKRTRARRGDAAAGAAMMGLMIGAVGGVIAAQQRREAYENYHRRAYGYRYGYQRPYVPRHQPGAYRNYNPNWPDRYQRIDPQNPNTTNYGPPRIGW